MLTFDSDDSVPFGAFQLIMNNRSKIRAVDTYFKQNDVYDFVAYSSWEFVLNDPMNSFVVCDDFVLNWVYYKRMLPNQPC